MTTPEPVPGSPRMLFGRDDLLRLLQGLNPWWASGRAPTLPPFRRALFEPCRRHVDGRTRPFALIVSGLRGAGKTTVLLQLAADLVASGADPRSVLYLGMGHPILSRVALPQILQLHRQMIQGRDGPAVLLLDEFHYARDWDQHVKAILAEEGRYRIVATESAQMIETALVTETQLNRWSAMAAPTLSFYEYLRLRGLDPADGAELPDLAAGEPYDTRDLEIVWRALEPVRAQFRTYLVSGGLPGLATHVDDPGGRGVLREDAVENILRRDVGLHFGARNADDLKRLFVFLCMHTGDVFPVQRYAQAVEVSAATVASHLEILERCFLVRRVAPYAPPSSVVKKPRYRVFASDTTVRCSQLLRDEESLTDPEELQRVVATSALRHVFGRHARNLGQLSYWRDPRTGRKVELAYTEGDRQTAYKVVCNRPSSLKPDDPLVAFCRKEPIQRAFIVTPEDVLPAVFSRPEVPDTEFVKVPAHVFAYLYGRAEDRITRS